MATATLSSECLNSISSSEGFTFIRFEMHENSDTHFCLMSSSIYAAYYFALGIMNLARASGLPGSTGAQAAFGPGTSV